MRPGVAPPLEQDAGYPSPCRGYCLRGIDVGVTDCSKGRARLLDVEGKVGLDQLADPVALAGLAPCELDGDARDQYEVRVGRQVAGEGGQHRGAALVGSDSLHVVADHDEPTALKALGKQSGCLADLKAAAQSIR